MKVNDFLIAIENSYVKRFPKSKISIKLSKNIYNHISINCFLAGEQRENSGSYWENDIFKIRFSIDNEGKEFQKDITIDSEITNNLQIETHSNYYLIKPTEKFCAYGSQKISFRKTKGDAQKILNTLDKYFEKLYNSLYKDLNKNNINDKHTFIVTEKLSIL